MSLRLKTAVAPIVSTADAKAQFGEAQLDRSATTPLASGFRLG